MVRRGLGSGEEIDVNFAKAIGPDYWEKRKSVFDFRQTSSFLNQGRMQAYVGDNPVTFKGPAVRVATKAFGPGHRDDPGQIGGRAPLMPGVVTHSYGKGRVVYFAAGFDAAYYFTPILISGWS